MIRKPLFKRTFALLFIIGFLDFLANTFYLYWTVWWFDMIMHFISGACVGMAAVLIWQFYFENKFNIWAAIKIAIISAFVIGILWEFYELYFEITSFSDGVLYWTDTSSDLLLDVSGGILGALYGHKVLLKSK